MTICRTRVALCRGHPAGGARRGRRQRKLTGRERKRERKKKAIIKNTCTIQKRNPGFV